jgi:hypothetical protein
MSRVEPKDHPAVPREAHERNRQPVGHTPGQAEGDERTVDEALRNSEENSRETTHAR